MVKSTCLGMPRIGANCELPKAINSFLSGSLKENQLTDIAKKIRLANIKMQIDSGIDIITSNDFSLYDHVLDTTTLVGRIPRRYYWEGGIVPLSIYFAMIVGQQQEKFDAMPMSFGKFFNTHYTYVKPEFIDMIGFAYSDNKPVMSYLEAKQHFKKETRTALFGPISYLLMGKYNEDTFDDTTQATFLEEMLPIYEELFANLHRLGVKEVQFDEPMLATDLTREQQKMYKDCYTYIESVSQGIKINIITSYGTIGNNLESLLQTPMNSLHIDLVHGSDDIIQIAKDIPETVSLSLGLVDSQNVFVNDIANSIKIAQSVIDIIGSDRVVIAPSSSLFLCPLDAGLETEIEESQLTTLSFAKQKLAEVATITKALNEGMQSVEEELKANAKALEQLSKNASKINEELQSDNEKQTKTAKKPTRNSFAIRHDKQNRSLKLPMLPIVSVGAMQMTDVDCNTYTIDDKIKAQIATAIQLQESNGVDIVTYGEVNRHNDEEYFAHYLNGLITTKHGYIQQSGRSFFKPAIICGTLSQKPNTKNEDGTTYLDYAKHGLSVAKNVFKFGILGPISMINGAYMPANVNKINLYKNAARIVASQIEELEKTGIKAVGINEDRFLQFTPLRQEHINVYVKEISDIFKSSLAHVSDETQIHTHMAYYPFADVVDGLAKLDSDILLLESARSGGAVFESFVSYKYPNGIALGVFDPSSNRIPTKTEIGSIIKKSTRVLDEHQIAISTDVGIRGKSKSEISKTLSVIASSTQESRKMLAKYK